MTVTLEHYQLIVILYIVSIISNLLSYFISFYLIILNVVAENHTKSNNAVKSSAPALTKIKKRRFTTLINILFPFWETFLLFPFWKAYLQKEGSVKEKYVYADTVKNSYSILSIFFPKSD